MTLTPYISEIEFEGGDRVGLQPGSVFVAVGPNNAGKSHFLAQLRAKLLGASINGLDPQNGLVTAVRFSWGADKQTVENRLETLALKHWQPVVNGFSASLPDEETDLSSYVDRAGIHQIASQDSVFQQFLELFVRWDEPVSRIQESEWQQPSPTGGASLHVARHEATLDKVSNAFSSTFKQPISVYDKREGRIGFILGKPNFDAPSLTKALDEQTLDFMDSAPKLRAQGMGMRNVFGLLARFLTDSRSIVLMDEPEAFLHPPQAAQLGELLGQLCQESGKQLICATHDRNFLAGLARSAEDNLRVRRFDFKLEEPTNQPSFVSKEVNQNPWKTIRNQSRVRYSNVLDALFSRRVILVEAERDAFFYHQALESLARGNPDWYLHADDYLFLPVGGNAEFAPMITLMRELSTPVFVIGDLDLIADEKRLTATANAAGIAELQKLVHLREELYKVFEDFYENRPPSNEIKAANDLQTAIFSLESDAPSHLVDTAKKLLCELEKRRKQNHKNKVISFMADHLGSAEPESPEGQLKARMLEILCSSGIFLLPIGELEDFDRELLQDVGKSKWAAEAIANGVHERNLAQSFILSVIADQ